MFDLPIVDAHVHLWDPNRLEYPWQAEAPTLNRPFLLADYQAACGNANVERMVFLQCEVEPTQYLAEVAWVTELAESDARLQGMVPFAPLERGVAASEAIARLAENKLVKGVRRLIQSEKMGFCLQPNFVAGVQLLPEHDFSFDICIYHTQMGDAVELVRQCPNVKFVLDHIGKPDIKHQQDEPWKTQLQELAGFENVWCKISGLITEANHETWQPSDLTPYIQHVLETFGFDRVMFAGDWPVVTLAGNWSDWLSALTAEVASYSPAEQLRLFRDNAIDFYRLPT